ncbi:conserved hypothetical protein [Pseudomonas protegens Pf-5]|uniref:Uncharacterized protein n=1 Tax=Pseudomonas fluorescens (strain ATCC BAA-477 / NRRL B-23932 / Pf-5) TaxID=220664 RepID=Q4KG17_PSEF5|nr:conserved hypothetical protein [Pseudomonas protegens Pf-5]
MPGQASCTRAGASDAFAHQDFDIGRRPPEPQAPDQAGIGFPHQVQSVDGLGRGPFDELAAVEVGQAGQLEFTFIEARGDRDRGVLGAGGADEVAAQVHHTPTGYPPIAQGFIQPSPGATGKTQAIDDHAAVDDQPQLAPPWCLEQHFAGDLGGAQCQGDHQQQGHEVAVEPLGSADRYQPVQAPHLGPLLLQFLEAFTQALQPLADGSRRVFAADILQRLLYLDLCQDRKAPVRGALQRCKTLAQAADLGRILGLVASDGRLAVLHAQHVLDLRGHAPLQPGLGLLRQLVVGLEPVHAHRLGGADQGQGRQQQPGVVHALPADLAQTKDRDQAPAEEVVHEDECQQQAHRLQRQVDQLRHLGRAKAIHQQQHTDQRKPEHHRREIGFVQVILHRALNG